MQKVLARKSWIGSRQSLLKSLSLSDLMKLLVLSREDVRQLIQHCLSSELLANQAGVFQILSAASNNERTEKANPTAFEAPLRTAISLKKATTLFMPARMGEDVTCKLVGVPKNSNGLSASTAVLDGDTGSIKAIINSTALTALRNAAGGAYWENVDETHTHQLTCHCHTSSPGSALATLAIQSLTRFHSSPRRVTLFGSGQQSLHHAAFFSSVYESRFICSSPLHLDFISRSGLSESVFNELHGLGVKSGNITSIQSKDRALVKESVSSADIIICCTPSLQPLFPSEWVKGGTHIVLIGSCG